MIPALNDPVWRQFATGKRPLTSSKLSINLLETNLRMEYRKNPCDANIQELSRKVYEFFVKYDRMFADEFKILLKQ